MVRNRILHLALWLAQIAAAVIFFRLGLLKLGLPMENPKAEVLVRIIGVTELLAAGLLIFPALFRTRPLLTPFAALWLVTVMVLAAGFHVYRGEFDALPFNLLFAAPVAFVAWGRLFAVPILGRGQA